jgi:hypothetical protein
MLPVPDREILRHPAMFIAEAQDDPEGRLRKIT